MANFVETTHYGEPIDLTWNQQLAAFWSLYWPSWLVPALLAVLFANVSGRPMAGALLVILAVMRLLGQGILLCRFLRKNYRTFWIGVVRPGEPIRRHLDFGEMVRLWLQVVWLQIAFLVTLGLLLSWNNGRVSAETMRSINSLSQWLYVLVVGPAAIRLAIYANYPGFRLQAYRPKRKIHLNGDPNASNPDKH